MVPMIDDEIERYFYEPSRGLFEMKFVIESQEVVVKISQENGSFPALLYDNIPVAYFEDGEIRATVLNLFEQKYLEKKGVKLFNNKNLICISGLR